MSNKYWIIVTMTILSIISIPCLYLNIKTILHRRQLHVTILNSFAVLFLILSLVTMWWSVLHVKI